MARGAGDIFEQIIEWREPVDWLLVGGIRRPL